ncbi:hypothetical protein COLO4_27682 [Corchorus olitorius]|uniref:Isocitrate lyase n=1 Tax=Corchorus olitorius TaxID=93759 RepID=A0A1R3HPV7_9ROSI|nr:hypothetical protein COLO4_27682 [Corchorus olitorius]
MAAIVRGWAFAPHADIIWMETSSPDLVECTKFSEGVKSMQPEIMLAYNLSPSFNWDASGMTDEQMKDFIPRIAKLGFCWQFITLAGFHADALVTDTFARDYARRGMLAYVERIQREERNNGVDTLAHQKWSGVTEEQFKETWTRPGTMNNIGNEGDLVVAKARMVLSSKVFRIMYGDPQQQRNQPPPAQGGEYQRGPLPPQLMRQPSSSSTTLLSTRSITVLLLLRFRLMTGVLVSRQQLDAVAIVKGNEKLSKYGDTKSAWSIMLVELKKLIEANPLFREKLVFPILKASHLRTLINQSLNWQLQLCKDPRPNPDIKTLLTDHSCPPPNGACAPTPVTLPGTAVAKPSTYAPLGAHGGV